METSQTILQNEYSIGEGSFGARWERFGGSFGCFGGDGGRQG